MRQIKKSTVGIMANAKSAFVFSHSPGMNAFWHSPYGICRDWRVLVQSFSINIPSLPNQRQMRLWHLAGLKNI